MMGETDLITTTTGSHTLNVAELHRPAHCVPLAIMEHIRRNEERAWFLLTVRL